MSSINFQEPYSEESAKRLRELFGEPAAFDALKLLYNHSEQPIVGKDLSAIARKEKQIVELQLHAPGEVKEMSDGTKYQVDEKGNWRRIFP